MSQPSRMNAADRNLPVFRSVEDIPPDFGHCVAAIGNFDGVHLGHREVLAAVVHQARASGLRAAAITFDPHPERFLRPDTAPRLLTPIAERVKLLAGTGIDAVVVLHFDAALAKLTPAEFVRRILVDGVRVRSLHEGGNFRFGHRAAAGVKELADFGGEFGFEVQVHDPVHVRGLEVSSSAIRSLLAAGDVRRARWMLGRPFVIRSAPARGRGVGTKLLVPTVNLAAYDGVLPGFGVYVTRLAIGSRCFHAVTNVGNRPTFQGVGFGVETHILNFEPMELAEDTPLELEFLMRLRPEIAWPTPAALKAQIMKDVARAAKFFRRAAL